MQMVKIRKRSNKCGQVYGDERTAMYPLKLN